MPDAQTSLLGLTIAVALAFDFTNGFHDTANAVATTVGTRALPPRLAVAFSALLNLLGAIVATQLLHTEVANTVGSLVAPEQDIALSMIIAALFGAISWNLITWRAGLPSSSSHALIGGLIGMGLAAYGLEAVVWAKVYPVFMAIITLALLSSDHLTEFVVPTWVVLAAALAIGLGTWAGGWRIIRTMSSRIIKMEPVDGFVAETVGAAVIQAATSWGLPVSTTHVVSGSVMGAGATRRLSAVRWGVARSIIWAWIFTIPASATLAALAALLVNAGPLASVLASLVLCAAVLTLLVRRMRRKQPMGSFVPRR